MDHAERYREQTIAAFRALGLLQALVQFERVPHPHLSTAQEILASYEAAQPQKAAA